MISGYSKPDTINKAFNHFSLSLFIEKPWDIQKLKKSVKEVIKS